jgi:hypothetical protein
MAGPYNVAELPPHMTAVRGPQVTIEGRPAIDWGYVQQAQFNTEQLSIIADLANRAYQHGRDDKTREICATLGLAP